MDDDGSRVCTMGARSTGTGLGIGSPFRADPRLCFGISVSGESSGAVFASICKGH